MSLASHVTDAMERPPAAPRPWTGARIAGAIFLAVWVLIGLTLIIYLVNRWNPELFSNYAPKYMQGLWVTVQLVVISMIIGSLLSIPIAYGRMSRNPIVSSLAYAYVYFFRGTPLLAQTFLIYYGLGSFRPELEALGLWTFLREAWYCGILAFSLNTAAYQAEILRGAIQSIPKGQWEGAAALGLPTWLTMRKIIAPQALIVALRPYGNELILMIKGSAIVSIITVYDLMGETRRAFSRSFDFQTYIWAAIIYLTIVELLRHIIDWIERKITKHLIR